MRRLKITVEHTEKEAELKRNLTTLFETRAGSQPADRDFGINWDCLEEPPEVAESLFYLDAVKKVERYEPRVEIEDIAYEHTQGGMKAHIYFKAREG